MDEKSIAKIDNNYNLIDIFNLMKKVIMNDTHVATLALYSSTIQPYDPELGYGIIEVKPFPLKENQDEYSIVCYVIDNRVMSYNQILTIVYTDLNFIDNLQVDKRSPQRIKNQSLHTQTAGVVISENPLTITPDSDDDYIHLSYNGETYKLRKY